MAEAAFLSDRGAHSKTLRISNGEDVRGRDDFVEPTA